MKFDDIGLQVADILLPDAATDHNAWAVIACDQYSSQPEYWQRVAATCAGKTSTLQLIYPEVYLESADKVTRIQNIHTHMHQYLESGTLRSHPETLVLCQRTLANGAVRKGVMVALDLEQYSYESGAQTLIRSTEGTIVERLPPRIQIRENAPLELPHIMVLIDDPGKTVIEPLFDNTLEALCEPLYETPLMLGAGHLQGWALSDAKRIQTFVAGLQYLAKPEVFRNKYDAQPHHKPLLYAMGDGNHSFATAKAIWENLKRERGYAAVANHPARHALVELVNLYDNSLQFEPIHRVVFDVNVEQLLNEFCSAHSAAHITEKIDSDAPGHSIPFMSASRQGVLRVPEPSAQLAAGTLQQFLDTYLQEHSNARIDYIHGETATRQLASAANNIGFLLPAIDKNHLFKTVIFDGALPRKTFSMGDAEDKRFYFECRKIQE